VVTVPLPPLPVVTGAEDGVGDADVVAEGEAVVELVLSVEVFVDDVTVLALDVLPAYEAAAT